MMRLLILILAILVLFLTACARPDLSVESVNSELDAGRMGSMVLSIRNAQTNATEEGLYTFNSSDALCLVLRAVSHDDRLRILSEPLHLGSLRSGSVVRVEIDALAGEDIGIYPVDIILSYMWLSSIETSGGASPEVYFLYENSTDVFPVEVKVVTGPVLSLFPSKSSIEIKNLGDRTAKSVSVQITSPVVLRRSGIELGDIPPGKSKSIEIPKLEGEEYPVVCMVNYTSGFTEVSTELASVVRTRQLPGGAILLLVPVIAVALYVVFSRNELRRIIGR
ncbi:MULTISPECIES: COG1361 family protein [Methanothrix]|uniref:CARDB domain-containing protein n=2 Tax=Methanothrix TaxID=2222 RepID=A0B8J1_METTP|nr:hypothetical protein [Methanothrix thermoacetophila]ABK15015.1 hypothetical protein Mthe_1236 [Methanothrix thermoacetophila PT]